MSFDHVRSIAGAAGAAILTSTLAASTAGLVETQEMSFAFPLSPGGAVLPFAQFDDMAGARVLQKASMSITGSISAVVTAENDSTIPAPDLALAISGFMTIDFAGLGAVITFSQTELTDGSVGRSDGVTGSGPDFWDFGMVSAVGDAMEMTMDALDGFVGGGTIDGDVVAAGGFSVAGSTDSTLVIDNFMGGGTMTIVYEYRLVAGACCFPDGSCTDATMTDCEAAGGVYQGAGTDCDSVTCPTGGGEGCTPGYWKQPHHFGSWSAGLASEMLFADVFEDAFPGLTLLQVLRQGGGKLNALGRHTVAALLNASSNDVSYELSAADVIAMFNAAYPGTPGAYNDLKNLFEDENQSGCPLGRAELDDPTSALTPGGSDFTSLLDVLSSWGVCMPGQPCRGDLDGDGVVDVVDLIGALTP